MISKGGMAQVKMRKEWMWAKYFCYNVKDFKKLVFFI